MAENSEIRKLVVKLKEENLEVKVRITFANSKIYNLEKEIERKKCSHKLLMDRINVLKKTNAKLKKQKQLDSQVNRSEDSKVVSLNTHCYRHTEYVMCNVYPKWKCSRDFPKLCRADKRRISNQNNSIHTNNVKSKE